MSLRDVTIAHIGSGVTKCEWRHAPEERGGFWEILKKSVELRWDLPRKKTVGFRLLAETFVAGATRVGREVRWKSQNRKIVPLSPYVEEPLNSKVIKCSVPGQRSRQEFFVFRDSYYLSLWTFDVRFTYCHIMAMVQLDYICLMVTGPNCCSNVWKRPTNEKCSTPLFKRIEGRDTQTLFEIVQGTDTRILVYIIEGGDTQILCEMIVGRDTRIFF